MDLLKRVHVRTVKLTVTVGMRLVTLCLLALGQVKVSDDHHVKAAHVLGVSLVPGQFQGCKWQAQLMGMAGSVQGDCSNWHIWGCTHNRLCKTVTRLLELLSEFQIFLLSLVAARSQISLGNSAVSIQ